MEELRWQRLGARELGGKGAHRRVVVRPEERETPRGCAQRGGRVGVGGRAEMCARPARDGYLAVVAVEDRADAREGDQNTRRGAERSGGGGVRRERARIEQRVGERRRARRRERVALFAQMIEAIKCNGEQLRLAQYALVGE